MDNTSGDFIFISKFGSAKSLLIVLSFTS